MPEPITDYIKFIRAVLDYAESCWVKKEGKFEVSVSDDKGIIEASVKGGATWRSRKGEEE